MFGAMVIINFKLRSYRYLHPHPSNKSVRAEEKIHNRDRGLGVELNPMYRPKENVDWNSNNNVEFILRAVKMWRFIIQCHRDILTSLIK
jgi:hypothetical protein